MMTQYIALIPAYNPTDVLCDLVRSLCNAGFSIVVVNDGSNDSCSGIFDDCTSRARVLHLAGSETDCTVRQDGDLPDNLNF